MVVVTVPPMHKHHDLALHPLEATDGLEEDLVGLVGDVLGRESLRAAVVVEGFTGDRALQRAATARQRSGDVNPRGGQAVAHGVEQLTRDADRVLECAPVENLHPLTVNRRVPPNVQVGQP